MRLTADVLLRAESYLNALKEREINLRGFKIPAIENLAVLQDQYDSIDISDNEVKKLDNFPVMKRLNTLLVNNNYVSRIGLLGDSLRGIKILVLTNNRISSLADIDNIATLRTLEHLSLLENPVSQRLNYRLYVIFRIPSLKTLDFAKVSRKEREEAAKFFESKSGQEMIDAIAHESRSSKAIVGGDSKPSAALTEDQKRQVRAAIGAAKTREDVDRIEKQLKTGTFLFTDPVESTPDATEKADSSSGGAAEESVMSVA